MSIRRGTSGPVSISCRPSSGRCAAAPAGTTRFCSSRTTSMAASTTMWHRRLSRRAARRRPTASPQGNAPTRRTRPQARCRAAARPATPAGHPRRLASARRSHRPDPTRRIVRRSTSSGSASPSSPFHRSPSRTTCRTPSPLIPRSWHSWRSASRCRVSRRGMRTPAISRICSTSTARPPPGPRSERPRCRCSPGIPTAPSRAHPAAPSWSSSLTDRVGGYLSERRDELPHDAEEALLVIVVDGMPASREALEAREPSGNDCGDVLAVGRRGDRIVLARDDERRTAYSSQRVPEVEAGKLVAEERHGQLKVGVGKRPRHRVGILGLPGVERETALHVLGQRLERGIAQVGGCGLSRLPAAKTFEHVEDAVTTMPGGGVGEDQRPGMIRMSCCICLRDETSERYTQDDRLLDLQRVTERSHIVSPAFESASADRIPVTPPVLPVLEVDDLCHVSDLSEPGLELGVVKTRSPVQQEQGGLLPHRRAVRHELRPIDVEEEADIAYLDTHVCPSRCRDL